MYKISVPLKDTTFTKETANDYVAELKAIRADRALIVLSGNQEDLEDAKQRAEGMREIAELLRKNQIEPAIWIGKTLGHGVPLAGIQTPPHNAKYQTLVNLDGEILPNTCCPLDIGFRKMIASYVATLAKYSTVKLIFLDDDYRLSQRGKSFCCACEFHMARMEALCGEKLSRTALKKLAFASKPNKYRDAWLSAQRESLELFAKEIRAAVDRVDREVCVSLCAAHSIWGVDGSSATDISRILAGQNKPVTRLHPAPYWATYSSMPLPVVFEIARMFAHFAKSSGSELLAEGDTYPRPRYNIPSSHLELFDAVIRADGTYDGILKYMIDYYSPFEHERGYVKRHVRNLPLMDEISTLFEDKECVGVYTPVDQRVMEYADLEMGCAYENNYPLPCAARMLSHLSIPTTYRDNGICTALFGESARNFAADQIKDGAILDAISAKILTERGIDVGLGEGVFRFVSTKASAVHTSNGNYCVSGKHQNGRFMLGQINKSCEILAEISLADAGRIPFFYKYENQNGQKFVVCTEDTMGTPHTSSVAKGYHIQKILSDAAEWISGKKLPVKCEKNPDLYVLCKKSKDGSKMAVGLFNCYADSVLEPVAVLDATYSKIRFTKGTGGRLAGDRVFFNEEIPAFGFVAFEVEA